MAKFFPPFDDLKDRFYSPNPAEFSFLDKLKNLDDSYNIFFKPFINGDRPAIIICKSDSGLLLVEVNTWDLNEYFISSRGDWHWKPDPKLSVLSPFQRLKGYRKNIYNLFIEEFHSRKYFNPSSVPYIKTLTYFHSTKQSELNNFLVPDLDDNFYNKFHSYLSSQIFCASDNFNINFINKAFSKNEHFEKTIHPKILRFLKPPFHPHTEGTQDYVFSKVQDQLSQSSQVHRKIKGFAGSGKTLVLAKRAVNALKRTQKPVLILTFNITLINYIRDKIDSFREDFDRVNFEIINYHQFFNSQALNYNLKVHSLNAYWDANYFAPRSKSIKKYSTILIDEGQDFQYNWYEIIKKYFLSDGGEYVIFADEKQNIFKRTLEAKKPKTNIVGAWDQKLNKSFRLTTKIAELAQAYQIHFYSKEYDIDEIELPESAPQLPFEPIEYKLLDNNADSKIIFNLFTDYLKRRTIHPNDVCILSERISLLRELDQLIRIESKQITIATFESMETYELLKGRFDQNIPEDILDDVRRSKKVNFFMNPGCTKLSTIHSFKGWEINTLVLVIYEPDNKSLALNELVYTALTRCRNNLFIINLGIKKFDKFFSNYLQNQSL